jgi:hypothetical protein
MKGKLMKELIFVSGDNCSASEEVQEKVDLFSQQHPEVSIIRLRAGQDEDQFAKLSDGWRFSATPAFTAKIDGVITDKHQGKLCEVRLAKMFAGEDSEN